MKIIEYKHREHRWNHAPHTEIYPYIGPDDDLLVDDPENPYDGEEMGRVIAYRDRIELDYDWQDMPIWSVDQAEQFAHAMLKAVEISRRMQTANE